MKLISELLCLQIYLEIIWIIIKPLKIILIQNFILFNKLLIKKGNIIFDNQIMQAERINNISSLENYKNITF